MTSFHIDFDAARKQLLELRASQPLGFLAELDLPVGGGAWNLARNLIRGHKISRGFNPIRSRKKLANGIHPWQGFVAATEALQRKLPADPVFEQASCKHLLQDALRLAHLDAMAIARDLGIFSVARLRLAQAMKATPQGETQNAWTHGQSTAQWFRFLRVCLNGQRPARYPETSWPLKTPRWWGELAAHLRSFPAAHVLDTYLLWHDCGKPLVMTRDEQGRLHYPSHAEASGALWRALNENSPQTECIASLMEHDMCAHRLTPEDVDTLAAHPHGPALLIAALAQLHANARPLFGGFESDSFKAKFKKFDRKGGALMARWAALAQN